MLSNFNSIHLMLMMCWWMKLKLFVLFVRTLREQSSLLILEPMTECLSSKWFHLEANIICMIRENVFIFVLFCFYLTLLCLCLSPCFVFVYKVTKIMSDHLPPVKLHPSSLPFRIKPLPALTGQQE
jgi:hypothetical protein